MAGSSLDPLYGFLTPLAASASDGLDSLFGPEAAAAAGTNDPSLMFSVLRMLGALGLVLALLIATLWVFKRLGGRWSQVAGGARGGGVEVLHQRPLGGRRMLTVIRWEGRKILLGVTSDSITTLASELEGSSESDHEAFESTLAGALSPSQTQSELLPWGPFARESTSQRVNESTAPRP